MKVVRYAVYMVVFMLTPGTGSHGFAMQATILNDTGASRCYDASGSAIACNSRPAADDGRFGRDAAAASNGLKKVGDGPDGFDFTKIANDGSDLPLTAGPGTSPRSWACTRDNATGLVWEVKLTGDTHVRSRRQHFTWYNTNAAENGGHPGSPEITTYSSCNGTLTDCNTQEYMAAINAQALCGFRDWRLPTPSELRGIVNYSRGLAGEFNTDWFIPHDPQWPSPHYWTSATYAADPADTWLVEIGGEADGGGAGHHHPKNEERLILAVRGGGPRPIGNCAAANPLANVAPSTPTSDFVDHGNGTVTHLTTGLTWKRCLEGSSGESCETSTVTGYFFRDAVAVAEASTFAGFSDWRIPNLKELHSIVETCGHTLAINRSVFPGPASIPGGAVLWTSTPDPANGGNVYGVVFEHGGAVPVSRTSKVNLRLVRGGAGSSGFDAQNPPQPRRRSVKK